MPKRRKQESETSQVLREFRAELETLVLTADDRRTPGGLQPAGVYWNGFHAGIQVVLGRLQRYEEEQAR